MVSVDVEADIGETNKHTFSGVENLNQVLKIFEAFQIKATLFVTGEVLETYSDLVKEWAKVHEIACHNYYHIPLDKLSSPQREEQLAKFCQLYQKVLGKKPAGFRAVQHIIDDEQIRLLEKFGFSYDSSVVPRYPFWRKYVGYKGKAPLHLYHPSRQSYKREGDMTILEIPVTPLIWGIPLAGTWLRILGLRFYQLLLWYNKPGFISLTLHSWDGIAHRGSYSQNSGARFLNLLPKLLQILTRNYQFANGLELARTDKNHDKG